MGRVVKTPTKYQRPTPVPCVRCGGLCVAGQRDQYGRPCHLSCQTSPADGSGAEKGKS